MPCLGVFFVVQQEARLPVEGAGWGGSDITSAGSLQFGAGTLGAGPPALGSP